MLRSLAIKELRETRAIALIAMLAYVAVVTSATGINIFGFLGFGSTSSEIEIPFVGGWFYFSIALLGCILAATLGLRQSVWENIRGTYLFLLTRPAPWQKIILTKALIGLLVLNGTTGLAILAYAIWASIPGTHASPFEWNMTLDTWAAWFALPIVYLGAFLTGIRPARWWGTRLLPAAGSILLFMFLIVQPFWNARVICVIGSIFVSGCLLWLINFVATQRDYA